MKSWVLTGWLLLSVGCMAPAGRAQPLGHPLRNDLVAKAATYLVKDDSIRFQFDLLEEGVAMYASATDQLVGVPECILYWDEIPLFRRLSYALPADSLLSLYTAKGIARWPDSLGKGLRDRDALPNPLPGKPLAGVRIALDPGHVGGTMEMGELEWKYVRIRKNPTAGIPEDIAFNEGNLAMGTAILLDSMFRAAGAEVMMTRKGEGLTAFGMTYPAWLDSMQRRWEIAQGLPPRTVTDFQNAHEWERYRFRAAAAPYIAENELSPKDSMWWMDKAGAVNIYKGPFLRAELKARAEAVRAFQPHLTLIIHYNVFETNEPGNDKYRDAVDENVCMAFVPGAFMEGELKKPEDRLDFLIKLVAEDIDASVKLSEAVVKAHEELLGIPAQGYDSTLAYIYKASLPTPAEGVFARNLALTRQIHSVMCFGESLYQDNRKETVLLNRKDFQLPGMQTWMPNRIREVANAYYHGVLAWIETQR